MIEPLTCLRFTDVEMEILGVSEVLEQLTPSGKLAPLGPPEVPGYLLVVAYGLSQRPVDIPPWSHEQEPIPLRRRERRQIFHEDIYAK